MAYTYSVFKKGKRYAILNAGGGEYWLVNVETGRSVENYYDSTSQAKEDLRRLEDGTRTEESFSWSFWHGQDLNDRLPKSLLTMQERLRNPRQAKPSGTPKPYSPEGEAVWGATVTRDHGTFMTLRMSDGTFGYRLRTGEAMAGFRSPSGATLSAKRAVEERSLLRLHEIGLDPGASATDTLMEHFRGRVEGVYSQAVREMRAKQDAAMRSYESNRAAWEERVAAGTAAWEEYDKWLRGQAMAQTRASDLTDQLARTLADADAQALGMVNGYLPMAYAENYNYGTYQVEGEAKVDTSFTLYDESAVRRLLEQDRKLLPEAEPDGVRDYSWNRRKVTEAVTQGILQGESVRDISKRLEAVAAMDKRAAVRSARTALTGAQNAGRVDSYRRAADLGIDLLQEWQATYDSRVRHTHALLDGERVAVGEEFSNGCRYPADPDGEPSEVFNCRCTLVPVLAGLNDGDGWRRDLTVAGMTYDQWKAYHKSKLPKTVEELRAEADALRAEVDGIAARVSEARLRIVTDRQVERWTRKLEEARAEVRRLASVEGYDEWDLQAEVSALYRELEDIGRRLDGARSYDEVDRLTDLMNARMDTLQLKETLLQNVRDYKSAKWDVQYYEGRLSGYESENESAKEEIKELAARIREAVPRRNEAYGRLSDRLPLMPDLREKAGDEYVDAVEEVLREAEGRHPEIAAAYRRFSSQLTYLGEPEDGGGAYYSAWDRGVYLHLGESESGSEYQYPYQVLLHELAHMIDNVSWFERNFMSEEMGLPEVIRSDWAAYRESFMEWDDRFPTDESRDRAIVEVLKGKVDQMNSDERDSGTLAYANLSDIIEGCTGIDYPLGIGHGAAYHENEGATAHEFMAETFDAAMANEESYQRMRTVFPNAVRTVEELARRICQ